VYFEFEGKNKRNYIVNLGGNMLKLFDEFQKEFKKDKGKVDDKNKRFHKIMHEEILTRFRELVGHDYLIRASVGQANKAKYPWIAIFNKNITTTATKGLYIVCLFKSDMTGFYLSLNQGITNFKDLYHKQQYEYAEKVSKYFSSQFNSEIFTSDPIDLVSEKGDKGYGYEKTNILSKYYGLGIYHDNFEKDLIQMLKLYNLYYEFLNGNCYQDVISTIIDNTEIDDLIDLSLEKDVAERLKNSVNDNQEYEIVNLTQVEPLKRDAKTIRIERKKIRKIDYLKQAKSNMNTGYLGEMLVFEYEKERLSKIGFPDKVDQVKWVSKESDSYGYDITSLDLIDGNLEKIYIEVKTTKEKSDCDFFITENEIITSNKYGKNYYVYRVYNIEGKNGNFYIKKGKIEENFSLVPNSYRAKLK